MNLDPPLKLEARRVKLGDWAIGVTKGKEE